MAYIINDSRGQILAIVPDGTINTTASPISLVGRGVIDYGVAENENYVFILENFAKATAPNNPLQGQLWFNTSNSSISTSSSSCYWLKHTSPTRRHFHRASTNGYVDVGG